MNRMYFVFICCMALVGLASFTLSTPSANAQTNALRISVVPQHPGPFEQVSVTVEDFSRDLNKVNIAWSLNGKTEQTGVGLKRYTLTTGALGTVSNISINMGGDVSTVTIRPTVTDILWQADTYTPPFYKGKALHSNQDPVTLVAEPFFITTTGTRLDPEKLIYKWKEGGKINNNASGTGKRTFTINPSVLIRPIEVELEVTSSDNSYHSLSTIRIPDSKTEVLLYENDPLYGIRFEEALNNKDFSITEQEIRVFGVPMYFSNEQESDGQLALTWNLNNSRINQTENEVIFRKPEGSTGGRSLISLGIKNPVRYAQFSSANFYAVFADEQATEQPVF